MLTLSGPRTVESRSRLGLPASPAVPQSGFRFENEQSRKVLASEDAREGPLAFAQKRKPAYKGK